jgi:tetratricopeptide (TPR) repeat protein
MTRRAASLWKRQNPSPVGGDSTKDLSAGIAVLVLALLAPALQTGCVERNRGRAVVSETVETVRTYPFGDPDPVPIFARSSMWGRGERIYPYFFFDGFSPDGADQDWTVVRLENRHIQVAVLPQAGGKVWGASDKATGRDFLYWNKVLKFRQIALRGPWTSGGIEFNFGVVGHAPWTASPVDYLTRRNPDGSVSCFVGTLDLPSRTRWSVEIRLPEKSAVFETNALWTNPTPFTQSYYAWSCAAVKTADDLRYIFPGRWFIGHDYSVPLESWPVDAKGRDLSVYRNNAFPGSKSYFTVGEFEDFYGGWYEKSDTGFGHWARYGDMPGRKVWIWDLSRSGEIWVDLLTDADGQYTEPQAGRLLNQSDHGDFPPASSDRWRELWFPYRGIGPMVEASPDAVLGATRDGGRLSLGLFPLSPLDDEIVVTAGGREILREHLALAPEQVWKKDVRLTDEDGDFVVEVGAKLRYESAPSAGHLDRPLQFRNVREDTAEGLFLQGRALESERRYAEALGKYLACVDREPIHVRALTRMAELYARRGEPLKALEAAGRGLRISMYDPGANYVYGVAARREERFTDAKETLGWAARSPEFRAAARIQLAEIAILEGAFDRAIDEVRKALASDGSGVNAREVLAISQRLAGRKRDAERTLAGILDVDPLNHLARFERFLLFRNETDLDRFKSLVRNELPHETYLEIAARYIRLGLSGDAVAVLGNSPEQAEVAYWLAFLLHEDGSPEADVHLDRASRASPRFVFPFREEAIPVFQRAVAARPADWKPKYYLGLIYWSKGRLDEARDLFAMCEDVDFPPFFLTRASLLERVDPRRAAADYRRALELDPANWRARHALVGFLLRTGRSREALAAARAASEAFPREVPIEVDLVKALMAERLYGEAAALLDGIESLPYEGASDIHRLYLETHVALGLEAIRKSKWGEAVAEFDKSKLYPERLGTGEPFAPDVRLQDYLAALCLDRLGRKEEAAARRQAVYDYTIRHGDERGAHGYFGGLVLQRFGKREDRLRARELLGGSPPPAEVLAVLRILE